jgi:AcrR family transcriptional regulator
MVPTQKIARSALTEGRIGRPSKSVSEALDDTLLASAIQAMRDADFNEISLDKLAARIGVSKPTIYRRFNNRSALIEAMVEHEFAALLKVRGGRETLSGATKVSDQSDPLDDLRDYAQALFDFSLRPSTANFVGFLHQEALLNPRIAQLRHEWHVNVLNNLIASIRGVQASGRFAPSDPAALATLLIDLMQTAISLYPLGFSQKDVLSGMTPPDYFQWRLSIFLTVARSQTN